MSPVYLSIGILLSMVLNLGSEYQLSVGQTRVLPLKYLSKPLTMLLTLGLAWQVPAPLAGYKGLLLVALLFSTAGDIFLMLPQDLFLGGLISFLIAHLFLATAMLQSSPLNTLSPLYALPFLAYAGLILRLLWPGLPSRLKIPVVLYVLAIMNMGWLTLLHAIHQPQLYTGLAVVAALLFIGSDSCLAWNRFRSPFAHAQLWILGSYFSSQYLFALSVYGLL